MKMLVNIECINALRKTNPSWPMPMTSSTEECYQLALSANLIHCEPKIMDYTMINLTKKGESIVQLFINRNYLTQLIDKLL